MLSKDELSGIVLEMYKSRWFQNLSPAKQEIIHLVVAGDVSNEFLSRLKAAMEDHLTAKKKIVIEVEDFKLTYRVCDLDDVLMERLNPEAE